MEKGNPLQYSCLENPLDREAWWATFHEVTESWHSLPTEQAPRINFKLAHPKSSSHIFWSCIKRESWLTRQGR